MAAAELRHGDEVRDRRRRELGQQLGRPQQGAQRDQDRTDARHGDGVDRPVDAIRPEQTHPVAFHHTVGHQARREAAARLVEVSIRDRLLGGDDGPDVTVGLAPTGEEGGNGLGVRAH